MLIMNKHFYFWLAKDSQHFFFRCKQMSGDIKYSLMIVVRCLFSHILSAALLFYARNSISKASYIKRLESLRTLTQLGT